MRKKIYLDEIEIMENKLKFLKLFGCEKKKKKSIWMKLKSSL